MGEAERAALLREVRALAGEATVTLRYVVELQLTRRIPGLQGAMSDVSRLDG
jgi:hypothetical protein